jgi:hypothetical protein
MSSEKAGGQLTASLFFYFIFDGNSTSNPPKEGSLMFWIQICKEMSLKLAENRIKVDICFFSQIGCKMSFKSAKSQ